MTIPVSAHITTVSQKVPVEETSAWRTGFRVWAAAATIGAEPNPDSLEKDLWRYQILLPSSRLHLQILLRQPED